MNLEARLKTASPPPQQAHRASKISENILEGIYPDWLRTSLRPLSRKSFNHSKTNSRTLSEMSSEAHFPIYSKLGPSQHSQHQTKKFTFLYNRELPNRVRLFHFSFPTTTEN